MLPQPELLSDPELWNRIAEYSMPRPAPAKWLQAEATDFKAALVRDMSVSASDAERLVLEYRKFLYLKALDGGTLSPPPDLDELWHKHIDSSDGAWASFCSTVAGKPLEHRTGLSSVQARAARSRVVALYNQEFGAPPPDIWPDKAATRDKRLGDALTASGIAIAGGGLLAAIIASPPYDQGMPFWVPYSLFGGIGVAWLGSWFGSRRGVKRTASCG